MQDIYIECGNCDSYFQNEKYKQKHTAKTHKETSKVKYSFWYFRAINEKVLEQHMQVAVGHKIQRNCWFFINGACNTKQCKYKQNCFKFPLCGFSHYELCPLLQRKQL